MASSPEAIVAERAAQNYIERYSLALWGQALSENDNPWNSISLKIWDSAYLAENLGSDYYNTARSFEVPQKAGFIAKTPVSRSEDFRGIVFGAKDSFEEEGTPKALHTYISKALFTAYRDTISLNTESDSAAKKTLVVNDAGACSWCRSMRLIGTNNYTKAKIDNFGTVWRFHDSCKCTLRPIWAGTKDLDYFSSQEKRLLKAAGEQAEEQGIGQIESLKKILDALK